jgi:hypothetical protein
MSIFARIRDHGGDVIRDKWRMRLRPGRLPASALAWLQRPDVKLRLHREVWPEVDEFLERAAIREYDGGQDREHAERAAYQEIINRTGVGNG